LILKKSDPPYNSSYTFKTRLCNCHRALRWHTPY